MNSSRRGAQAAGRRHAESLPPLLSDSSSEKNHTLKNRLLTVLTNKLITISQTTK